MSNSTRKQVLPKPKTRFLPIRSKSGILTPYEMLRHPSKCRTDELWELYKYIEAPTNTILTKTPSIVYSSRNFDSSKGCFVLGVMDLKTKEDWDNMTKPPKGWIQHKGWRQKINKP